ncbi:MAG: G8 domain-containing protein [Pseudomonadota bacterium]
MMNDHGMSGHAAAVDGILKLEDASHIAIKDGAWSDPGTWDTGRVPGSEADVYIPAGTTVTYDMDSETPLHVVRVDGELTWSQTEDTKMVVETIVTDMGSTIEVGSMADPMPTGVNAEIVFRDTPITDDAQITHGLVAFGEVDIQGAEKESYLTLEDGASRGATSVKVDGDLSNWEIGDTLLFVGTERDGNGSQDEERTITSISGDTISFDRPLDHDHKSPDGFDFDTFVGNLSRNVVLTSENPDGVRGHVMLHNGMPDPEDGSINSVRYAEFRDLGRTDESEPFSDTNVMGRYPLHLHEIGTDGGPASMIEGNSVHGSPGWGIVQHSSHAMINHNIVYDTVGSGIVSEDGDETGMWIGNLVTSVEHNDVEGDHGHPRIGTEGAAYENQSRVIVQQDNIAANSKIGWNYSGREDFEFGAPTDGAHRKMFDRDEVPFDPSPFDVALDHEEPPIVEFNNNTSIASGVGLRVFHRQYSDDTDTMSVFREFDVWGGGSGVFLDNYASNYQFMDSVWQGDGTGFRIERKTSSVVFNDVEMHDFDTGYLSLGANHEVVLIDTSFHDVETTFDIKDVMRNVDDAGLRNELISYFRSQHGINYENPMPKIVDSRDLTPLDAVTFTPASDADLRITSGSSSIDIRGTITDSVGDRRFNEYVIAKPPNGQGTSKDFEGVQANLNGGGTFNKEFTTAEFFALHGTLQKDDGSWVVPVVNWITDRLTGVQHPVVIEIELEGYSDEYMKSFELPSNWQPPEPNNPDFDFGVSTGSNSGSSNPPDDDGNSNQQDDEQEPEQPDDPVDPDPTEPGQTILGTSGDDRLFGSNDDDVILGKQGDDRVIGADGDDEARGGEGEDSVWGKAGADLAFGGVGRDEVVGGHGEDTLSGGKGGDKLRGGWGEDILKGGKGDDNLRGGRDADQLFGGGGDDKLVGGKGSDTLTGEDGADLFVLRPDSPDVDTIEDFSLPELDAIQIKGVIFRLETDEDLTDLIKIETQGADGLLTISETGDPGTFETIAIIKGGAGLSVADLLEEDRLGVKWEEDTSGGSSAPPAPDSEADVTIQGTGADEKLVGGSGSDVIAGRAGEDTLIGEAGDDVLIGGGGSDVLRGKSGSDFFVFDAEDIGTGRDNIQDFSIAEGDVLDLSGVFGEMAGPLEDYLRITATGKKANLYVDVDGGGDSFEHIAVFSDTNSLTVSGLMESDSILF